MDELKKIHVRIVSSAGRVWDGEAFYAVLPAFDGEIGFAAGHAATIARMGAGEARIYLKERIIRFVLLQGFLEIEDDELLVLVEKAESPQSVDVADARARLKELGEPHHCNLKEDQDKKEFLQRTWHQARIRLASIRDP
jgi:F-type H+-transporting ATPase subunit epsilon